MTFPEALRVMEVLRSLFFGEGWFFDDPCGRCLPLSTGWISLFSDCVIIILLITGRLSREPFDWGYLMSSTSPGTSSIRFIGEVCREFARTSLSACKDWAWLKTYVDSFTLPSSFSVVLVRSIRFFGGSEWASSCVLYSYCIKRRWVYLTRLDVITL